MTAPDTTGAAKATDLAALDDELVREGDSVKCCRCGQWFAYIGEDTTSWDDFYCNSGYTGCQR